MLYTAPHEYMSTVVSTICIYSIAMSLCTYYARVVLVGHTIVVPSIAYTISGYSRGYRKNALAVAAIERTSHLSRL